MGKLRQFGLVSHHGGSGSCDPEKRLPPEPKKNGYCIITFFFHISVVHAMHFQILPAHLALSFRTLQCADDRRGPASSRLGAALCPFLHHGSSALLPPLLPCNAVQQHADRCCFFFSSGITKTFFVLKLGGK